MNASGRPNTCKSNGSGEKLASPPASGARVRNAYATYLQQGDSPGKLGLMPHGTVISHDIAVKDLSDRDGHAYH